MRKSLLSAFAISLLAAFATHARADGVIRDGIGAISIGRGGTNLGFADNGAIILDNPAAMSNIRGNSLMDVGIDTVICDLNYSDPDNPNVDADVTGFPSGMFGYVRRDPCSPWAWGFGVYAPAGFGADFHMDNPNTGDDTLYKSLGALLKVLPAVSYEVNDRLSVGASLGLGVSHAELEGPFYQQTGPFAGAASNFDLQGTDVALVGGVGMQYKVSPRTMLGLAYTEESRFVFDDATARATFPGLGGLETEFDAQADLVWPRSLGIGLKHELCNCRRVAVDVIWFDWSHAFDRLDLKLSNPSNPVVGGILGDELRDSMALDWNDTVSLRFGYEWDTSPCYTWRAGYVFHDSPVDSATLTPYLDGVLEHAVSLGVTRNMQTARLNLSYQYSWHAERHVGNSQLVGDDFSNSTFDADAHWIGLSVLIPR